ncbi:hypothetical protein WN943_022702 [Citrus x changshan-huyou]
MFVVVGGVWDSARPAVAPALVRQALSHQFWCDKLAVAPVFFLHENQPASGPVEDRQETEFFHIFNVLAIAVAVYLLVFDITGNHGRVLFLYFAVGLIFLLALPLAVPLYVVLFKSKSNSDIDQPSREPLLAPKKSST